MIKSKDIEIKNYLSQKLLLALSLTINCNGIYITKCYKLEWKRLHIEKTNETYYSDYKKQKNC